MDLTTEEKSAVVSALERALVRMISREGDLNENGLFRSNVLLSRYQIRDVMDGFSGTPEVSEAVNMAMKSVFGSTRPKRDPVFYELGCRLARRFIPVDTWDFDATGGRGEP